MKCFLLGFICCYRQLPHMVFITVECTDQEASFGVDHKFYHTSCKQLLYCSCSVDVYVTGALFVNTYASEKRCITVEGCRVICVLIIYIVRVWVCVCVCVRCHRS